MRSFDVVVIGSGPAGEVVAGRLGGAGLEVALIEDRLVGGECAYWACMPSKALLRPAEVLAEVRRIPGAAEAVTGSLDVAAVLRRRDEVIHDLDDATQLPWLEEAGVVLFRGRGTVTAERTVQVEGGETLEARRAVVLASGSRALVPPIEGLREAEPWTNVEATTAKRAPDSLVVLGGGVVGVEMAQAYASFGTHVTVVEALDRLIAREEPFASEQVADALRERGVTVQVGRRATRVERAAGAVAVTLEDGTIATGEELLVAIGRRPSTAAVEALGYEPGKPVDVDHQGRSARHDWLWAVGDVNGIAPLTHMGKYQARLVADAISGRRDDPAQQLANGALSPRVIFTDPQVAAVGHTLQSARDAGIAARAVDVGTSTNAGGSFYGRGAPGTARIVIDDARGVIAGATVTGADVADFLHAFTIAVVAEVPLERLWHAVPPFPTRSELWLRLLETAGL
ncbi:MAG TPA: NAD(P)/FAD-dependent oxidoreductase [Solirubrobacteraceae bacterium]|nr:NAD(P)/FAD-dependent oxidoreductase [Solirubrobacteraceae bacterium]